MLSLNKPMKISLCHQKTKPKSKIIKNHRVNLNLARQSNFTKACQRLQNLTQNRKNTKLGSASSNLPSPSITEID